jgi:hypothetical protein
MADDGEPEQQSEYDLLVAGGALVAAAGLLLSFWGYQSAPMDCQRFGQSDYFACGASAALTVVGDAVAALAFGALIAGTPIRRPRRIPFLGQAALASAVVAVLASPLRVVGAAEALSRVIAIAWLVMGMWLFQASRTAPVVVRSTLGAVLGVTLVASGLFQGLGEERPFPIGGAIFAIVFAAWAIRLTTRLLRAWRPPPPQPDSKLALVRDVLLALGVVFVAIPGWLSSTLGFAPIGDPAVTITISNGTDHAVSFFMDRDYRQFGGTRLEAGASTDITTLAHGVYFPGAADPAGNLVFCRRQTHSELRKMRYVITIVDDPGSCR